jgi:rhamnosyltransferase subunit B
MGLARTVPRHRYTTACVAAELTELLNDSRYTRRASDVARQVRQEDGVQTACDALEGLLSLQ